MVRDKIKEFCITIAGRAAGRQGNSAFAVGRVFTQLMSLAGCGDDNLTTGLHDRPIDKIPDEIWLLVLKDVTPVPVLWGVDYQVFAQGRDLL